MEIARMIPETQCTCPELTTLQRAAGFVTFINVMWVLGIALAGVCVTYLFGSYLKDLYKILKQVPKHVYAVLFYVASAAVLGGGWYYGGVATPYIMLLGSIFLGGSIGYNLAIREKQPTKELLAWLLFAAWTPLAIATQNGMIGFIAVAALLSGLGFSVIVTPLCYGIGFDEKKAVPRATGAAFIILTTYVGMHLLKTQVPWTNVFESGALFLGSFVGYLGLLILSSRWYDHESTKQWFGLQVLTIALGIAAIYLGSVLGLESFQKIGGTFLVLWAIEKPFEINKEGSKRVYAFIGLVVAAAIFGFCWYVRAHPAIHQYFFVY